ncbi:RnfABCDGE type electron transport complex subunit D [Geminocystis sp. GBBB08]|uniref:RnfABCDGE type electron transport complex subunit D n=1 Tax=Geminocystis sp. GBBB08 TaxID=2604140 RepID=UPI0027E26BEE|nr:RnfABCDGE type electron transport complex subunit D [Geminocystis sp. GBBB08]MBL1211402.1 Na+-transporting NADH:ubiquinone oxidoreductase, subunit NqrB [Geminocystis sp. GBBB08]
MKLFKDARDYQITWLCLFLSVGIFFRDWTLQIQGIFLTILTCVLTQIILSSGSKFTTLKTNFITINNQKSQELFINSLDFSGVKSALITGLGLSLLLRSNSLNILMLASFLAIASKFIFNYHQKHFFNPANFGIIVTIFLTKSAWVSPGQWGSDWWYLLLFTSTGAMVLNKVGRWETSAVFLSVYASLEATYNYYLGWNFDVLTHQLMSGSLLVFAFFMLTDPRSIPNAKNSRIIWAIVIGFLSFILKEFFYINSGIFLALFIISPLTILFDLIWKENRFRWQKLNPI